MPILERVTKLYDKVQLDDFLANFLNYNFVTGACALDLTVTQTPETLPGTLLLLETRGVLPRAGGKGRRC